MGFASQSWMEGVIRRKWLWILAILPPDKGKRVEKTPRLRFFTRRSRSDWCHSVTPVSPWLYHAATSIVGVILEYGPRDIKKYGKSKVKKDRSDLKLQFWGNFINGWHNRRQIFLCRKLSREPATVAIFLMGSPLAIAHCLVWISSPSPSMIIITTIIITIIVIMIIMIMIRWHDSCTQTY